MCAISRVNCLQVSCTVTFDPEVDHEQLAPALELYQYQLKGVSLLPRVKFGAFPQMPYEAVSEAVFKEHVSLHVMWIRVCCAQLEFY